MPQPYYCPVPDDVEPGSDLPYTATLPSHRNTLARCRFTSFKERAAAQRRERERRAREERRERRKWSCGKRISYHMGACFRSLCCCAGLCGLRGWSGWRPWFKQIRKIEAFHGSNASTYFKALAWLLKIDLACMLIGVGFLVAPGVYLGVRSNETAVLNRDSPCSTADVMGGDGALPDVVNGVAQFLAGNGWMEGTPFFIGWYPAEDLFPSLPYPHLYCGVVLAFFCLSLVVMTSNVAELLNRSAKESLETQRSPYTRALLLGWDFAIVEREAAELQLKMAEKRLVELLAVERQRERVWGVCERGCTILLRFVTNTLCAALVAGYFYLLLQYGGLLERTGDRSCNLLSSGPVESLADKLSQTWQTYSAPIIIALGNTIFPAFFNALGRIEGYRADNARVRVTMLRSGFMKLASLCATLYLIYTDVSTAGSAKGGSPVPVFPCWENHMASKLYQLWLVNHVIFWAWMALRKLLCLAMGCARGEGGKKKVEFNITEEILELSYRQMLVWCIFPLAPLMTVVAVAETILTFYIKKIIALRDVSYSVVLRSETANVVNLLFLFSLVAIFTFYGLIISDFQPSEDCGPFRGYDSFTGYFETMTEPLGPVQGVTRTVLQSAVATIIIIVVFSLGLYYCRCLVGSKSIRIKLLMERIKSQETDRKFLLQEMQRLRETVEELSM